MPHMTFDWMTVALLRPTLAAHGLDLADLAASLHGAVESTFRPVTNGPSGREVGLAEFATSRDAPGGRFVELAMPGWNPFMPIADRRSFPALPAMWGGVSADGEEHKLHPSAIVLHPSLVALPTAGGGMMLFRTTLPATVLAAATGRRFADLVAHPALDGMDLVVRRLRDASNDELRHLGEVPFPPGASTAPTSSVATFRNDKTPTRVAYRI